MRGGDEVDYRLIISDEYVRACGEYIENQGKRFDQFFTEYITILQNATSLAFCSGEIHTALNKYTDIAIQCKGIVSDTSQLVKNTTDCFLDDIDDADSFLY